jgi:hypothetical protein
MKRRQLVLATVLVLTVVLALTLPSSSSELVQVTMSTSLSTKASTSTAVPGLTSQASGGTVAVPRVLRLQPRFALEEDLTDTFAVRSWQPPAPPAPVKPVAVAAAPPPPPRAPRAPFTLIGRYEEGDQPAFFVEYQQRNLVARTGELLSPDWQVESIGSDHLVLQYLPLAQKQVLAWAKAAP